MQISTVGKAPTYLVGGGEGGGRLKLTCDAAKQERGHQYYD